MDIFFDDLFELYQKYKFKPESIINCDETNNPTVEGPQNIVLEKEVKAVISDNFFFERKPYFYLFFR